MNLLTTLKGSLLESFFPPAWDLAAWDACIDDDPKAILVRPPHWHADFSVRMVDNVEDFNVMLGPRTRHGDSPLPGGGAQTGPDSARRAHGHVSLDGLLPARVEGSLRPRLWIQHGRVERRGGQHLPPRQSQRISICDGSSFLRPSR